MNRRDLRERIRAGRVTPGGGRELTRAILERTTGSVCGRARELVVASSEEPPDATTAQLLAAHLDGCAGCRAFADAWLGAHELLPALAERDPGPRFAASILALTSNRPISAWAAWWSRIVSRPRFSLEATYVAASLCVVLAGNPIALAGAVAERVQLLAPAPVGGMVDAGAPGAVGAAGGPSNLPGGNRLAAPVTWWDKMIDRVSGWWNELNSWMSDVLTRIWNYFGSDSKAPPSGGRGESDARVRERLAAQAAGGGWNPRC